jgi:hypothetical protein
MIKSIEQMIDQYILAWNVNQAEQYQSAFAACWDLNATYSDPNFALIEGLNGLVDFAKAALREMGPRTFSVILSPQAHDHTCLYQWRATFPDGRTADGFDFIEYNEAFKITRLVSFY